MTSPRETLRDAVEASLASVQANTYQHRNYDVVETEFPFIDIATGQETYTYSGTLTSACVAVESALQITVVTKEVAENDDICRQVFAAIPSLVFDGCQLLPDTSDYLNDGEGENQHFSRQLLYVAQYNINVDTGEVLPNG